MEKIGKYGDMIEKDVNFEMTPRKKEKMDLVRYTYRDNARGGEVIFVCTGFDILEADKKYEEKFGEKPEKQSQVGCSVEKIKDEIVT